VKEEQMAKRIKKPPVSPERRRQWFIRHDQEGESAPQIAKADNYDVRTVRKLIEVERQAREGREARSMVLRLALEHHYEDLCSMAKTLNDLVAREEGNLSTEKDEPLWIALNEHLPRSPIWKLLGRWEVLYEEVEELGRRLKDRVSSEIEKRSPFGFTEDAKQVGLSDGAALEVAVVCKAIARGKRSPEEPLKFVRTSVGEGISDVEFGENHIGRLPNEKVEVVRNFLSALVAEAMDWEEYSGLAKNLRELDRVKQNLKDQFNIIILRRVVPGRCRYCPI
jgi:hypothetical protein